MHFLLGAFVFLTNTGKETEFLLFSDPKRIFFIYFSLYSYIKCRYLSGIKKKHTKAPVSLRFTALEEKQFYEKDETFNQIWIRDPCNHRGILSRVPLVVCSRSSSVAMTASEKRCSNIVCTLPSWCTWGHYGNQNGITWLWRTIRANQWDNVERQKKKNKIRIKSQITLLVTFIPALPKMSLCVCVLCSLVFPRLPLSYCLCKPVMTVCCQYIGCTGGKNMIAFFLFLFLGRWLTFNNNVAVTLQSKSFKRNLMWSSILKLLWVFNWLFFLKLYFL